MSFVSIEYLGLLVVVFTLLHATDRKQFHNLLILSASYLFYAWWDWRFLSMVAGVSLVNFWAAQSIERTPDSRLRRNVALSIALVATFATLAYFKYANFFLDNFYVVFGGFGMDRSAPTLQIILPLGISFLIFQAAAYTIDVWRGEHEAEYDPVKFLAFIAFFPQLVAGPIERARDLLDQFDQPRTLNRERIREALWYLLYGFVLKVALADSLAPIVDSMFDPGQMSGWSTVLGTVAFGLQIYCDFYGYSLIAKGSALLLGFELKLNFLLPYWATSIGEFWRRWHVTLSSWLRDYLYIALGGNRRGNLRTYQNLLATMILGGLWHGASYNFVLWGMLHGVALVAWRAFGAPTNPTTLPGKIIGWTATMAVVFAGWLLFRASDWNALVVMLSALGHWEWFSVHWDLMKAVATVFVALGAIEYFQVRNRDPLAVLRLPRVPRAMVTGTMLFLCLAMARQHHATFIYFQF